MDTPAHFVLVHGAGHGAWCWFKLESLLETEGYKVSSFDLAGGGIHPSDPDDVGTFQDYDKPLFDFMKSLPKEEKVILVGHSAGGLSLVHMMHAFGEKIDVAVFVAATMLPSGFVTKEDEDDGFPDLKKYGDVFDKKFSDGTNNPTSVALKKEFQRKIVYQKSPKEDSILASKLLRPWPYQALTNARFQGGEKMVQLVRRVFIKTTCDHVLKPNQQNAMIRRWPPSQVCWS